MITDLIVGGTIALTLAFVAGWWRQPDWRASIERPKFDFQRALQGYDRARRPDADIKESHSA